MIGIVGGGLTGLLLGRQLQREGIPFVVHEAKGTPGGVIRSQIVDGHLLDWGPQRTRLIGPVAQLVRELGLEDDIVTANPDLDLLVYRAGRLRKVPFSGREFLASNIVGWGAKARLLLEPFTAGPRSNERVAEYFRRKLGEEVYRGMVGPLYGGLYGSDPEEMEMGLSLCKVLEKFGVGRSLILSLLRRGGRIDPPPACTFREGMQMLPRALADSLGDRLRLSSPVHALRRLGDGWIMETEAGSQTVDQVVVTTPAPVAARLLEAPAPEAALRIRRLNYNPLVVAHLRTDATLEGMGFQVAFGEEMLLKGVTFNHALFGRDRVYTAYLGGAQHPEIVDYDDARLGELAAFDFERTTGVDDTRVLSVVREWMPAWDLSWRALEGMELPRGLTVAANWESRPGIPGRMARAAEVARSLSLRKVRSAAA
jgi:oxygen-dependent protoporphyrinogen oxidase